MIATQTKVDVAGMVLPERLTDEYFRRTPTTKKPGEDSNLFSDSKQVRVPYKMLLCVGGGGFKFTV